MLLRLSWLMLIAILCTCTSAFAQIEFTQADRDRLIQLLAKIEQVDQRIDEQRADTNRRFQELREDMNARFEQVNNQFNTITNLLVAIVGAFAVIVAMTIGFALWDRRTMLRPVEEKVNKLEKEITDDVLEQVNDIRARLEKMEQSTARKEEAETEKRHHVQKVLGEMQNKGGDDARWATTFRSLL